MKRMLSLKNEEFVDSDNVSILGGKSYVEIYSNPTSQELRAAFKEDVVAKFYKKLRAIFSLDDKTLYIVVVKDGEMIHDQILKLLSSKGLVRYSSRWEEDENPDYMAMLIENDFSVTPSFESYYFPPENINLFEKAASSNSKLKHLSFDFSFPIPEGEDYLDDEDFE